jgi:hypothetical protein
LHRCKVGGCEPSTSGGARANDPHASASDSEGTDTEDDEAAGAELAEKQAAVVEVSERKSVDLRGVRRARAGGAAVGRED